MNMNSNSCSKGSGMYCPYYLNKDDPELSKLGLLSVYYLGFRYDDYMELTDELKESYPGIYSLEFYFQNWNEVTNIQKKKFLMHIESLQIKNIKSINIHQLLKILLNIAKIVVINTKN